MRALVYGLARSGRSAAERLDDPVLVDRSLGNEGDLSLLDGIEVVVKSPGVPGEAPLVVSARERGIPRRIFQDAFASAKLTILREAPCMFPTTRRGLHFKLGFDTRAGVLLDAALSRLTAFNNHYHPSAKWHKIQPTARSYVLRKNP